MDPLEDDFDKEEVLRQIAGAIPMEGELPPAEPAPVEQPSYEQPPYEQPATEQPAYEQPPVEPLADLPPPEPLQEPLAEALPPPYAPEPLAAAPAVEEPPRMGSNRALPRPTWWERHRHEAAGLVTALVALVWISLGVAARAWAPSLIGVTFALGALLIGTQAVWAAD
jgi:hypothetical protein